MRQCSFGGGSVALNVLPSNRTTVGGAPAATIMDYIPIVNAAPFAMCQSAANPPVIAATAAKLGVFTPMQCAPATLAPWIPAAAPTFQIGGAPALDAVGSPACSWRGAVTVLPPGR